MGSIWSKSLLIQLATPKEVNLSLKSIALSLRVAGCTLLSFYKHNNSSISASNSDFLCKNTPNYALILAEDFELDRLL